MLNLFGFGLMLAAMAIASYQMAHRGDITIAIVLWIVSLLIVAYGIIRLFTTPDDNKRGFAHVEFDEYQAKDGSWRCFAVIKRDNAEKLIIAGGRAWDQETARSVCWENLGEGGYSGNAFRYLTWEERSRVSRAKLRRRLLRKAVGVLDWPSD